MKPILYMAPIMGVTGCIYRNTYSQFFNGYDIAVMPFINNTSKKKSLLSDVLPERNKANFELVPQILHKNPKDFIILAKNLYEMGYKTVNWNLGCPLPMIRKKKKGSGLLPYSDEIVNFLKEVIAELPNQISLKVRLGSEEKSDLANLLPMLNDFPLKEIIIHPRTGKQLYTGEVDLTAFEESLSLTNHTIVYSGDIDSLEKYKILSARFPIVNRWMLGRGGITNPFLPEQIKNIESANKDANLKRFISFHQALLYGYQKELSGQAHLIGKMKEVWRYWVKAFEGGDRLFLDISRTNNVKKYLDTIEQFFREKPSARY
ncbi:dihydrouridine synthase DuS [Candidatus Omnitrophus magneticus]|uniref:tRNA-dihydrouridine synthase n=1 Tax=Candidatus Omnitrophus magneticus TaxID=1609969 RepID=A0A0F0CNN2_9BACT|nr:dihydrouridine synthase DuS [Candidatus Omnitrophus magneticus]